ncbi:hypothetical protein [Caulobacter sp. BK020]|uniref:hypothetical protein n=1 Tax=Caulobacter sp. BK020 TaxID=2512117 RepID=UPI00104E6A9B|nr:hypothetical protein [Caulobacter sp. BK020]TCS02900.1 hypothetical protein EV278_1351 [Caulobacter sp. BK020]
MTGAMLLAGLMTGFTLAGQQPVVQAPPVPPPDPAVWWSPEIPKPPPEQDPFQGRRLRKGEQLVPIDNGVDPLLYRLWGLQPLQSQLIKPGELVLEVWARPATGVRQAVVRVTVRRDGRAFVQARAGLGCCTPEISRRVDINAELATQQIPPLKALVGAPMWSQPRSVIVDYGGGAVEPVCLEGVSWDVTLLVPGQARHLRRACDDAEVGSIAPALAAALSAASGRDARFDAMFARGGDFSRQQRAYDSLVASGGQLKAGTNDRPQPPAVPTPADDEPEAPAPASP